MRAVSPTGVVARVAHRHSRLRRWLWRLRILPPAIGPFSDVDRLTPADRLAWVARETLYLQDAHLCLVDRELADELRVWSRPIQIRVEPRPDGLIQLEARYIEEPVRP